MNNLFYLKIFFCKFSRGKAGYVGFFEVKKSKLIGKSVFLARCSNAVYRHNKALLSISFGGGDAPPGPV